MIMRFSMFLLLGVMLTNQLFSQDSATEYFITVNVNLQLPINNPSKGIYPILWYDKESKPKLQIGGFGLGFSAIKLYKENLKLKGQANLSRHVYWDEAANLRNVANIDEGTFATSAMDYTLGIAGTAHYLLSDKFSAGTGLGLQVMLYSYTRLNEWPITGAKNSSVRNQYYKPVMPVLPLEVSLKLKRTLFTIRYEHGLLNRLKKDLAEFKNDKYGLLTLEAGIKIN